MRPSALESLRAVQATLAETIAPELSSPFAQDAAQTLQMLLESIAAEWDTAADHLRRDNETLRGILEEAGIAMKSLPERNENFPPIVSQIEQRLSEDPGESISISALASRNEALRGILEQTLMALEDAADQPATAVTDSVRAAIYHYLKDVASRGWSFWDVSSFRGRMTGSRSAAGMDDAP